MALHYGILRGRVDIFKREDDPSTPHLQIRVVDDHDQAWRVAVNVLSGDQSRVIFHRADPSRTTPAWLHCHKSRPGSRNSRQLRAQRPRPWTTFGLPCSTGRLAWLSLPPARVPPTICRMHCLVI